MPDTVSVIVVLGELSAETPWILDSNLPEDPSYHRRDGVGPPLSGEIKYLESQT